MNGNQLQNIVKATAYTQLVFDNGDTLNVNGADTGIEGDLISIFPNVREVEYRVLYSSPTLDKHGTSTPQELVTYWQQNGFFLTNGNIVADERVEYRADLPITLGSPAIGALYIVEKPTRYLGVYTTYQSGLYLKENDTGSLDDWRRLNIKPKFTDTEFAIVKTADNAIQLKASLSLLTANRTLTYQDKDGTVALLSDINVSNVLVSELSDLPTPVSSVITLLDSTIYVFSGSVNIEGNRLVLGNNTMLKGTHPAIDTIISTTTGALITSTNSNRIDNISVIVASGSVFSLSGSGTKNMLINFLVIKSCDSIGTVDAMNLFSWNNGLVASTITGGLLFTGNSSLLRITAGTYNGQSGSIFNLGTATFDTIYIQNVQIKNDVGVTGIVVASSGANLNSGGFGIITGCYFETTATAISGYLPLDEQWDIRDNGEGLITSDRFEPNGWGHYVDGETTPSTISLSTTPTKLLIDGLGGTSESDYLPLSIRGNGELWDNANDEILPISVGDSYDVRINVEVTSKGGGVAGLNFELDIGGGASPTIVVVDSQIAIPKSTPFSIISTFPIFCLSTFLTNKGQVFVSTDTGTATIAARSITIIRTSSGAN